MGQILVGILLIVIAIGLIQAAWATFGFWLFSPVVVFALVWVVNYRINVRPREVKLLTKARIGELEAAQGIPVVEEGTCRKCKKPLLAGAKFCSFCKTPTALVAAICPDCSTRNQEDAVYCALCGADLWVTSEEAEAEEEEEEEDDPPEHLWTKPGEPGYFGELLARQQYINAKIREANPPLAQDVSGKKKKG